MYDPDCDGERAARRGAAEGSREPSFSFYFEKRRIAIPSAKTRIAKSSALIKKTLELHIMPRTVCRRVAVFLLRPYTNTHTRTRTHIRASSSTLRFVLLFRWSRVRSKVLGLATARTREIVHPPRLSPDLSVSFHSGVACHFELVKRAYFSQTKAAFVVTPLLGITLN